MFQILIFFIRSPKPKIAKTPLYFAHGLAQHSTVQTFHRSTDHNTIPHRMKFLQSPPERSEPLVTKPSNLKAFGIFIAVLYSSAMSSQDGRTQGNALVYMIRQTKFQHNRCLAMTQLSFTGLQAYRLTRSSNEKIRSHQCQISQERCPCGLTKGFGCC